MRFSEQKNHAKNNTERGLFKRKSKYLMIDLITIST